MKSVTKQASAICLFLLYFSGSAVADCGATMADLISYSSSSSIARVQVSFTIKQSNGLSASSTPFEVSGQVGPPGVVEIDSNGGYLSNSGNKPGKILYSDRFTTGNQYGNPYATTAPDLFDMWINPSGYVWIYNKTWGVWNTFQGTCSNGLLSGWGEPIGQHNGSDKAMYVISFKKINYGYL